MLNTEHLEVLLVVKTSRQEDLLHSPGHDHGSVRHARQNGPRTGECRLARSGTLLGSVYPREYTPGNPSRQLQNSSTTMCKLFADRFHVNVLLIESLNKLVNSELSNDETIGDMTLQN
jgi:hypothetical protein